MTTDGEETRRTLELLKKMEWLKKPYSDMELDSLEHRFNERSYILYPNGLHQRREVIKTKHL